MKCFCVFGTVVIALAPHTIAAADLTAESVRRAIERGQDFLRRQQQGDGSWPEGSHPRGGVTALALLALLESGMKPDHPAIDHGLRYLRTIRPSGSPLAGPTNTYVVSLQTMVYCLARPHEDIGRIKENVAWLEEAQIKSGQHVGMWDYGMGRHRGDNSCTQFALLGLREAAELEPPELRIKVDPEVWRRVREHFVRNQSDDGGWGYQGAHGVTGSMTSAGISSLIIAGMRLHEGEETIRGGQIDNCGKWQQNDAVARGLDWLGRQDKLVETNPGSGTWHFYYLYGLERAARLSGQRFLGKHDWYREGAKMLLDAQGPGGLWERRGDQNDIISSSFALLFLSKGRSPVLMNKLRHDAANPNLREDWNNDRNDVRNLVEHCSRHWERRMTWQVVDAKVSGEPFVLKRVEDFLQAPVLFITGHEAPRFNELEKKVLRGYVDQGGFIFAEACCSRAEFREGATQLFKEIFPEQPLKVLPTDHAVWKADYSLSPDDTLEGIDVGCRTSVILSREDLSCYWQQKDNPELTVADQAIALRAIHIGTNVLAYATGKELLPDKLDARKIVALQTGAPGNRWVLQVGKLKHGGDYNVAPMAVNNLMASLRENLKMNVAAEQRELTPLDENLVRFPFLYMHGRSQFNFNDEQISRLREHLQRGGTLFADACCGREPFDTAFRAFAKRILPDNDLKQLPVTHELFGSSPGGGDPIGYDLSVVQYTKTMPRPQGEPFLEAIELDGRLVIIYSKYDIGCALERHQGSDCRGYTHESAVKIATNVILYALLQ
jgi:hypothetical protein